MNKIKQKRMYHISDILTVTTGYMVSTRGGVGLSDIMEFICQDDYLGTIGLIRMHEDCTKVIFDQYPELMNEKVPEFMEQYDVVDKYVKDSIDKYGEYLEIEIL